MWCTVASNHRVRPETKMNCDRIDTAADIVKGAELLRRRLYTSTNPSSAQAAGKFNIWCIAHVLNLAEKDCIKFVHYELEEISRPYTSNQKFSKKRKFSKYCQSKNGHSLWVARIKNQIKIVLHFKMILRWSDARRAFAAFVERM